MALVALDFSDALACAVALGLRYRGQDGEDQFGHAVAGRAAAEVSALTSLIWPAKPALPGCALNPGAP